MLSICGHCDVRGPRLVLQPKPALLTSGGSLAVVQRRAIVGVTFIKLSGLSVTQNPFPRGDAGSQINHCTSTLSCCWFRQSAVDCETSVDFREA